MPDLTPEHSEEIHRFTEKVDALDRLISISEGKILNAGTVEQAKQAIYEFCFFWVAFDQVQGMRYRLLGSEDYAGEMGDWAVDVNQELEAIGEGDWVTAKDHARGVTDAAWAAPNWTQDMGLDENFTYKNIAIFKENSEESNRLLSEFIKKQVNLVPDKTEPYTYPNLEILKAQVASL